MAYPLGMVGVIGGYVLLDWLGAGLNFGRNVSLQLGIAAFLGAVIWWRWRGKAAERAPQSVDGRGWFELPVWGRWLVVALLAWLLLRWLGIVAEVIHRPLFPWDAWYAYGAQAKVWFHVERLDVFANFDGWWESPQAAWAAGGVRHPPGIGLIQLWVVQCLGHWDDALMNTPWPLALASLGATLAGLARLAGVSLLSAVVGLWVVMGLPILNIQAVLAGYGDLWIAVYVLIATGACMRFRQDSDTGFAGPMLVAIAGLLLIKQVGLLWVCLIALGLVAGFAPFRTVLLVMALGVMGAVASLWWRGEPVSVSVLGQYGFREGALVFPGYTAMWDPLVRHLFFYPNWHLFWYLAILSIPMLVVACRRDYSLRCLVLTGLGGVLTLFALFALSDLGHAVVDGTSVNRMLLPAVPVLGLSVTIVVGRWLRSEGQVP